MANPEQEARATIDRLLTAAGWAVQDYKAIDRHAARGVAIREFVLDAGQGFADYLLYVDGQAAGVIEAKKTGATHRLLTRMADTGLVTVEKVGNQKYYQANMQSPVFEELAGLVRKTVGLLAPLRAALEPLEHRIVAAFVYGSVAKGAEHSGSDVDLMVIADDVDYADLFAALPGVEARLARPVNPNVMSRDEWQRKRGESDSFASRIASQPKLFVIGSENDLA
jgi:predicted nucleotidyltransferase